MVGQVLYDQLIGFAATHRASDISLEPKKDSVRVRIKINGAYYDQASLDKARFKHLAARIKLMGGGSMNPDETLEPQDGSSQYSLDKVSVDLRFNTLPSLYDGEMISIRLLDANIPNLADLRFGHLEMQELKWFLEQDRGMFISTGTTGSGKTTTLYALLKAHADPARKLITIEDPVEKRFVEACQIPVRKSRGITFGTALRAILRQDPDTILIGEIRDEETARVALQAALTGHKVLSTIHTNDAIGIFERMHVAWGIETQPLMEALRLCVGQPLFQRVCPHCCRKRKATTDDLLGFPDVGIPDPIIAEPVGCERCRGGIIGRIAAIEMVRVDCFFAELANKGKSPDELREYNRKRGFPNLAQQAAILVQTGIIPLREGRLVLSG
jgi:type II secretory ATPase GspE/PulE/Tfp pilus assembly ATPase PilB-like protein